MEEETPKPIAIEVVPIADIPEGLSNEEAISQGLATFVKGAEVPLIYGNGEKYAVDSKTAIKDIKEGRAKLYSEAEQQKAINEKLYGDQNLLAGALGVARGVTFGASDVAAGALGFGEEVKGLQEANPVSSTVGEIGSIATPMGLAGLGGKIGGKAGQALIKAGAIAEAPMAALTKTGKVTSTAVEKLLQGTPMAKIAGGIAGGAVEGGIAGSAFALGQAALDSENTAGEYVNAAIEGAKTGALLGGVIGGAIEGVPAAISKARSGVDKIKDKISGIKKEVQTKELRAANMLAKEEDPVLLMELSTGDYKVSRQGKRINEISNEYGLNSYPEQITDDAKIISTSQKLLRSKGETGIEYRTQLVKDAEKATDIASTAITEEIANLRGLSNFEKGQFAEATLIDHFKNKLEPFRKPYQTLEELGSELFVDTRDFFKLFERWAKSNKNTMPGLLKDSNVTNFVNQMRTVDTMQGVQNVQKQLRERLRSLSVDNDSKKLLNHLDDYITDNLENFARPWKGTGPLKKDKAWQEQFNQGKQKLDEWINLKRQTDQNYAIIKKELEGVQDIVKIPKDAFKSGDRLLQYFETPGKITPEDFLKKVKDSDALVLQQIEKIPGLKPIAKAAQVESFLQSVQPGRGKKGLLTSAGNDYVDLLALNDKWTSMTKEQKNFLFSPKQQKDIEAVIEWNSSFGRGPNKVTPQKYLTESLGDTLSKSQDQTLSTIAASLGGGAIGGASLSGLVLGVVGGLAGKKISQTVQNLVEARMLNKIKGFQQEASEMLSLQSGIIGTMRKSEAKTRSKIKDSVDSLIDNFNLDRAKIIKSTMPSNVKTEKKDVTSEELYKKFDESKKELEQIRGNEFGLLDIILEDMGPIKDTMTGFASNIAAQQVKIAQYQLSLLPKNPFGNDGSPFSKMWKPSDSEMRNFMLAKRSSEQPLTVIEDVKKGVVSPVSINALRELYPSIYGDLTQSIKEKVMKADKPLSEDQKAVIAIVLGGSFDETFDPSFISSLYASTVAPQSAQAQEGSQPSSRSKNLKQTGIQKMKIADRSETQTERVNNRT